MVFINVDSNRFTDFDITVLENSTELLVGRL